MVAHAQLSPSGSSRWLLCPGSVRMTSGLNKGSGDMALRGSFIHQIGEELLIGKEFVLGQKIFYGKDEAIITKDMLTEANDYCSYVKAICNRDKNSELTVEMKVDLTDIAEDTFGHADAVVIENGNLHIVDLKTGASLVDAENNSQMMLYAYGVYKEMEIFHDLKNITLHIVQNNDKTGGDKSTNWSISPEDLIDWIENTVKPKAKEALSDDAQCVPGEKQCKWCDAASFCKALHDYVDQEISDLFDAEDNKSQEVTIEMVTSFLSKVPIINSLVTKYNERIFEELNAGKSVPGFKLVKSSTHKKWKDEIDAFEKMKRWAPLDEIAPRKLCTPTQAEKILGAMSTVKKNKFNELWARPEGQTVVVPSSDKRPEVKPVANMFEDLDTEEKIEDTFDL